jgi:hypothetical protein
VTWWPAAHPLPPGEVFGNQDITLFIENSDLFANESSSSDGTVTWTTKTHSLQSGQCPGGEQPIHYREDRDLMDINISSTVRTVYY